MSTAKKCILTFALASCLLLTMVRYLPGPVTAQAAQIEGGPPDIAVYQTVIGFAGQEWYVIGDQDNGVKTDNRDYVTLLLKTGQGQEARPYADSDFFDAMYDNGEIQMSDIYTDTSNGLNQDTREQALVAARDSLDRVAIDVNGNHTLNIPQHVWLLSDDEYDTIFNDRQSEILAYSIDWWLRTCWGFGPSSAVGIASGERRDYRANSRDDTGVRPAFRLNLASVIFTSSTASGDKSDAVTGSGLVRATAPTQNLKLTVKDPGMSLDGVSTNPVTAKQGETFDIAYTGASTGSGYYVSCVLEQGGVVKYCGKLAAANSGGGNAPVKLPTDIPTGSYDLRVFVEEVNGNLYTDFASDPVAIPLTVEESAPILERVAGQIISVTGGDGSHATPFLASIGLGHSVDSVSDSDLVASHGATARLYVDDTYAMQESLFVLKEGANALYIKVVSQGGVAMYYRVTATRAFPGQHVVTATANPLQGGSPTATPNPATATQIVKLEANPASGFAFDRWESVSPGVAIASPTQLTITFEMPHNDVEVVAHYTQDSSGGNNGGGRIGAATTSGGSSRSDDSGGASYTTPVKTQIPDGAFSWDGDRTLTIDCDGITVLGLTAVQWDGMETTAYSVHQGSVVVRFDQDFIGSQSSGEHRVRVEFLNHYGETTVTVGEGATSADDGSYDDAFVDGIYNPNTGDGSRLLILLALLGCFGGLALAVWGRRKRV